MLNKEKVLCSLRLKRDAKSKKLNFCKLMKSSKMIDGINWDYESNNKWSLNSIPPEVNNVLNQMTFKNVQNIFSIELLLYKYFIDEVFFMREKNNFLLKNWKWTTNDFISLLMNWNADSHSSISIENILFQWK